MAKKKEINPKCGENLSHLLAANGVKQKELAEELGYTDQHMSLIIRGKRRLTYETAQKIARMFPPVRVDWLLGLDDYETEDDRIDYILGNKQAVNDNIIKVLEPLGYKLGNAVSVEIMMRDKVIK